MNSLLKIEVSIFAVLAIHPGDWVIYLYLVLCKLLEGQLLANYQGVKLAPC